MKNRISITAIRKAGTSIVLAAAITCAAAGCGKSSDDSSSAASAVSTAETSGDAASSDTGTGSDFANVVTEDSSDSDPEPTELEVGSLTLQIPGYYSLDSDNSSGSDIDKIYTYEVGKTGAILEIALTDSSGISDSEFRDYKETLLQTLEEGIDKDKVTLTKSQETEYMGMPGFSYDFSGEADDISATLDIDIFLDSDDDKLYVFRFVKAGNPERDVASDYGSMMKKATWSDSTTAKVTESEENKDDSSSDTMASSDSAGVDPDLKATLDSYEKIMNEYCDFMEKYENADSSDMISMLDDYYKMLDEYTDAMDALNKLDTSNMSTADYKYYLDVTNRVSKRLLKIGQ